MPSLTAADAFIAAYFEEYEAQKRMFLNGSRQRLDSKKMAEEVSNMLYGGGFV